MIKRPCQTAIRASLLALALALPGPAQTAPLQWVDGRPMLRATLRAGQNTYACHLLIDLSRAEPLFLHANAARALGARAVELEAGGISLRDLPVLAGRDRWLEALTARYATELHEVPVAGVLGVRAFAGHTVVLDGPGQRLELLPAAAGSSAPPATQQRAVVELALDPLTSGIVLPVTLAQGKTARFVLHSRDPFGFIDPELAKELGHPAGDLQIARVGSLDLAALAPLRPLASPTGDQGGIGGNVLQQMVVTLQLGQGRAILELQAKKPYPKEEAAYYRARFLGGSAGLQRYLREHAGSRFCLEAARELMARLARSTQPSAAAFEQAALAAITHAPGKHRAKTAVEILENLPEPLADDGLRRKIIEAALPFARQDKDGHAEYELQLALGQIARRVGDPRQARRHLLAAAFGMPADGRAHLELGRLYEQKGQLERARGSYFLAIMDAKHTGEEGLLAFARVHRKIAGEGAEMLPLLEEMAEGRVPALHPIGAEGVEPGGRVVLVELFTGAQCPPCVAADVACDALAELHGAEQLVLIQWHLPIPAAEPLVSPVAEERAHALGVSSTPTVWFGGQQRIVGGGKADQAPALLSRFSKLVEPMLAEPSQARIEARARLHHGRLELRARVTRGAAPDLRLHAILVESVLVYPGRNGMLFHHEVARARLTPAHGAPSGKPLATEIALSSVADELDLAVSALETRHPFLIRPVTPRPSRLSVVLFLQNDATHVVPQALRVKVQGGP